MTRLIPGKTKVDVELFRGVTIGDVIVGGVGIAMLIFVLISSLPYKIAVCIGVCTVTGLLLVRIDEEANYLNLLHSLSHFGYNRRFEKRVSDRMLLERAEGRDAEAAIDELFGQPDGKRESREENKARAKAKKEDDRLLKSKKVSEEEKEAIRSRRKRESEEAMRRLADAKDANTRRRSMDELIAFTEIRDNCIEYFNHEYYGAAIEIDPVEFRFFSEHRRRNSIEGSLGRILRSVNVKYSANIVKLERPIRYESYLQLEYEKLDELRRSYENGLLDEDELKARVEVEYDRINELLALCGDHKVVTGFYYLVLFESDKRQLELQASNALSMLRQGELAAHRLNDRELAVFLKYSNALDFDEHEIEKLAPEDYAKWAKPDTVDIKARRVEINHIMTHNFRVVNYPTQVGDAWLAGVMSMPGTKVVVKAKPMDRVKAIRSIDRSLMELRGQWSATGVDSKRLEIEQHLNTLQELLGTLQADNESLLEVNVYITAYDITATRNNIRMKQPPLSLLPTVAEMKKAIRRVWQESSFRIGNMEFNQMEAFIGSQINGLDPLARQGRGIPSNTVAACFPWIFAHISDEGGIKLGESDGIPVFIDFFRRDSERVNSNMVIVGKSGSGKSYATKSILSNLAADDAKIFILDPENEYTELAHNLHGGIINVGNAQYGRLNPFHIITALDDDEAGEGGASGSYATHLQFLEEFFRQILPDCDKDSMEYLNSMVDQLYMDFGITPETDLSKLEAGDYPIFDDLYDAILQEFQSTDNEYLRTMLRTLMNYIAKFSAGGRNANIWNGPSTITTDTNFTVFNFQSMLANRNTTIANAQMLLVLKYIDNEIIKNRDYNMKYGLHRKIVVVIDEAHVFIDTKYPIALDFMFQLAKRIRKYNGMQIVITQNIKDFVGSEEIARKSTAIINACQYSFIFALAPNDIQDLVKLYENAGGINESEQEQIVQAPRGQAFTIMSPTSRSAFRVETGESMIRMFEDRNFVSRYFSGDAGESNWEDFVAASRQVHADAVAVRRRQQTAEQKDEAFDDQSFFLEEVAEEDYDAQIKERNGSASTGETADAEEVTDLGSAKPKERRNAPRSAEDEAVTDVMGAFTAMLGKMGSAFDRLGGAGEAAIQTITEPEDNGIPLELAERIAAQEAVIEEKDAVIEQMRLELEQLRSAAARDERMLALTEESESAEPAEPESIPAAKTDWLTADELFGDDDLLFDDEESETVSEPEVEPEAATPFVEENEEKPGGFDLTAFLNKTVEAARSMNIVEELRTEGRSSRAITFDELLDYIESRKNP